VKAYAALDRIAENAPFRPMVAPDRRERGRKRRRAESRARAAAGFASSRRDGLLLGGLRPLRRGGGDQRRNAARRRSARSRPLPERDRGWLPAGPAPSPPRRDRNRLACPAAPVKSRLSRALARLRSAPALAGYLPEEWPTVAGRPRSRHCAILPPDRYRTGARRSAGPCSAGCGSRRGSSTAASVAADRKSQPVCSPLLPPRWFPTSRTAVADFVRGHTRAWCFNTSEKAARRPVRAAARDGSSAPAGTRSPGHPGGGPVGRLVPVGRPQSLGPPDEVYRAADRGGDVMALARAIGLPGPDRPRRSAS